MSTLITGAGLIGCQTAALLAARGEQAVLLDLAPQPVHIASLLSGSGQLRSWRRERSRRSAGPDAAPPRHAGGAYGGGAEHRGTALQRSAEPVGRPQPPVHLSDPLLVWRGGKDFIDAREVPFDVSRTKAELGCEARHDLTESLRAAQRWVSD